MEVASALLDASKRLTGVDNNKDKVGDKDQSSSWFRGFGGSPR